MSKILDFFSKDEYTTIVDAIIKCAEKKFILAEAKPTEKMKTQNSVNAKLQRTKFGRIESVNAKIQYKIK